MSKATDSTPADKLALYDKLVATLPAVSRKGATVPYTSVNGHMFNYLVQEWDSRAALATRSSRSILKEI
jgi:hypothetical protein